MGFCVCEHLSLWVYSDKVTSTHYLFFGSFRVCLSCRSTFWCILGIVVWPYVNRFCNMTSNAPTSFVRAYLRASTAEQDASRAPKLSRLLPGKRPDYLQLLYWEWIRFPSRSSWTLPSSERLPAKWHFAYRGCGQTFPPVRGRLEYAEENDPAERHPGYGGECADDMD